MGAPWPVRHSVKSVYGAGSGVRSFLLPRLSSKETVIDESL